MDMRTKNRIAVYAAISAVTLLVFPAAAAPVTEREKQDCRADYQRYCKDYGLGTEGLRACMSRSSRKLSRMCSAALVHAGEMTKAQFDKLHPAGKAKKHSTRKHSHKSH
jgi:hypothetical protein